MINFCFKQNTCIQNLLLSLRSSQSECHFFIARISCHFRVFACISVSAVELGRVNAFISDYSKAKAAAAKLFNLTNRIPKIDTYDTSKPKLVTIIFFNN